MLMVFFDFHSISFIWSYILSFVTIVGLSIFRSFVGMLLELFREVRDWFKFDKSTRVQMDFGYLL